VVDDQQESRTLLVRILTSAGFATCEAGDGAEAVRVAATLRPAAILMDVRMPTMDGVAASLAIKESEAGRHTPIIAVSASAFEEDRIRARGAGMDDFVGKPFRQDEILEKLRDLLHVDYVYREDPSSPTPAPLPVSDSTWTRILATVPPDLIAQLRAATVAAQYDKALELVGVIAVTAPAAADELRHLVQTFDYQGVIDRLET
jgi:CheY-like chemotaxis protein